MAGTLVQDIVWNSTGVPAGAGMHVTLFQQDGVTLQPIFNDQAETSPIPGSTVTTDAGSHYSFWAQAGNYILNITGPNDFLLSRYAIFVPIADLSGIAGSNVTLNSLTVTGALTAGSIVDNGTFAANGGSPIFSGLSVNNNATADLAVTLSSGATDLHKTQLLFQDRGQTQWAVGKVLANAYETVDVINNFVRIHLDLNGVTRINSAGTTAVAFNKEANAGSGGIEVWSGTASPVKVANIDGSGNALVNTLTAGATTVSSLHNTGNTIVDGTLTTGTLTLTTANITTSNVTTETATTINVKNLEAIRFADQFAGATVTNKLDAAIADLSTNPGIVIVPSTLASGAPTSVPNNVTLLDFRGTNQTTPLGSNTITINGQTAGVASQLRTSMVRNNPDRSFEVITSVGQFTGAMPSAPQSLEGITGTGFTSGPITTTSLTDIVGVEGQGESQSTGGTLDAVIGIVGGCLTTGGSTTAITTMTGVRGGPPLQAGTGVVTNAFGGEFFQGATFASVNAAIHCAGNFLQDNATAFQMKKADGTVHSIFQSDSSNNTYLDTLGVEFRFRTLDGAATYMRFLSPNLEIDPFGGGFQLKLTTPSGTPPLSVASTTPVTNLTCAPATYGPTGTQAVNAHIVTGRVTLTAGTVTVTLSGAAAFSSSSSYQVTATDVTAAAAVKVAYSSGTSFTLTGTSTDVISFIAVGT